ncbi:MAG: tRNA pseudouridine(55) synthase TruB [Oscillospiraceae bacterium]|nr:tRNA pseudouridine(55) synthase TruB [Oscillospiraceae bacterium]
MNGIICVYKPKNYTSFDVVAIMRKIFNTRKIGHGGTLDPLAEGVLPIFIGNATRAVDFQPRDDKEYLAGFQFGLTTDTEDITGQVLRVSDARVSRSDMLFIEDCKGEIEQVPPMYSAVKINGEKLYNLARKGVTIERASRKVTIHSVKVEQYRENAGVMRVHCSKGTYIRTLIHDMGQRIGSGAVMTSLVRTRSGNFTLDDCEQLDNLQKISLENPQELDKYLMKLDKFYADYPAAKLDEIQTKMFLNGAKLDTGRVKLDKSDTAENYSIYAVLSHTGNLLALAKITRENSLTPVQKFIVD